jgi:tetratricopeptide (TPR) repeat protein
VMCDFAAAHRSDDESNSACAGLQALALSENSPAADWIPILKRLASATHGSPHTASVRCEYGKVLDQAHDWPRARSELESCVELDPNSVEAHFRLARVYRKLGLKELAAKEMARRASAEQREAALNEARFKSLTIFLYSISKR